MLNVYKVGRRWRRQEKLYTEDDALFGTVEWWLSEKMVPLGGRSIAPRKVVVVIPGDGSSPSGELTIEIIDGVPECRAFSIESAPDGRGVTTSDLRSARLNDWIPSIVAAAAMDAVSPTTSAYGPETETHAREMIRTVSRQRRRVTPEFLAKVAEVYRANIDGNPVGAVERAFGVERRTAAGYVEKARNELGLLPPTKPGQKKA